MLTTSVLRCAVLCCAAPACYCSAAMGRRLLLLPAGAARWRLLLLLLLLSPAVAAAAPLAPPHTATSRWGWLVDIAGAPAVPPAHSGLLMMRRIQLHRVPQCPPRLHLPPDDSKAQQQHQDAEDHKPQPNAALHDAAGAEVAGACSAARPGWHPAACSLGILELQLASHGGLWGSHLSDSHATGSIGGSTGSDMSVCDKPQGQRCQTREAKPTSDITAKLPAASGEAK